MQIECVKRFNMAVKVTAEMAATIAVTDLFPCLKQAINSAECTRRLNMAVKMARNGYENGLEWLLQWLLPTERNLC